MRARYTRSIGLPVQDEETGETLGDISGILIHPDTGAIEGFFVRVHGFLGRTDLFLMHLDILHWGLRITVRSRDVLTSVDDLIRLRPILEGRRTVLGQTMVTEGGQTLGRCADVQFSTKQFRLEWLFPKRFFRWGVPVAASNIVEVRADAIVLKDAVLPLKEKAEGGITLIPPVPEAA